MGRVSSAGNDGAAWARRAASGALLATLVAAPAGACDICAVYTASEMRELRAGLRLGVAEQFTRFTTRQLDSVEKPNPGEEMTSSITQLVLGYGLTPRVGVQLNLPIIARTYRRLEDGVLVRGNETGFGDLSLTGQVLAFRTATEDSVIRLSLLGGLRLPSGNPDRLAEEQEEDHHDAAVARAAPRLRPLHTTGSGGGGEPVSHEAEAMSAIHGHDLALGSGSVDGIVGASLFWSWRRLFFTAGGQYAIRTEGAFDYRYANDLTWSAGPGVYALLTHGYSLGLQALSTGETKGNDSQDGTQLDDTALTALYVGPGVSFSWGTSLAADLVADLPVVQHNTGLQIVADWRLRGGITWRF